MKFVCCQPPYVKRIGTSAAPRAVAGAEAAAEGGEGAAIRSPAPISAARARTPLPQLAETECTDERYAAADDPRQQHQSRRAQPLGDGGGRAKNPAADDPADYGHRSGEEAESAGVRRYFSDASNPA